MNTLNIFEDINFLMSEPIHQHSCVGCIECSGGDENLQDFDDPIEYE